MEDFLSVLKENNIPIRTAGNSHCREGWIQLDCPLCGKDSYKFHLGFSLRGGYLNCWRCGYHSVYEILRLLTDLSERDCARVAGNYKKINTRQEVSKQYKFQQPKGIEELLPQHIRYLEKRGYDIQTITKLWGIKGIGLQSKLSWRVYIPIIYNGQEVSWTTRSITNVEAKYITAPPDKEAIHHKRILYGSDYAVNAVIITEGPLDVWKIGAGAVATFGLNYTAEQFKQMLKFPIRAVCFDNEPVAQKEAKKLCEKLGSFSGKTYNIVLDSKDAGEASEKEIFKIRKHFLRN